MKKYANSENSEMTQTSISTERLRTAGIPAKMFRLDLPTFPWPLRKGNVVEAYIRRFQQSSIDLEGLGLYLFGEKGTGRTFLACHVMKEVLAAGFSAKYFSYDQVVSLCLSNNDGQYFETIMTEPGLLVIDNIDDTEIKGLGYFKVMLRLLQIRADNDKPMILVSTLNPASFEVLFKQACANLVRRNFVVFQTPGKILESELRQSQRNMRYLEERL
jgi:DNA replication protein DnaC